MEKLMTKEESYAERRKLFKNIWATAMHLDEKEADIMSKPKVIKTLRLDEVDRTNIGKSKKQKIKNLRNVCNRLLDFCDRQDADDVFYEQMAAEAREKPQQIPKEDEPKPKRTKTKTKRKMKKAKSCLPGGGLIHHKEVKTEGRQPRSHQCTKISKLTSPIRIQRPTVVKRATVVAGKNLNPRASPVRCVMTEPKSLETTPKRKVVKKKVSIRKKRSTELVGKAKAQVI